MSAVVSRIVEVEVIVLRAGPVDLADLDTSNETVVIRIVDEEGRAGIGETDAPAAVVRELVLMDDLFDWSRGLRNALIGADPFEIPALHGRLSAETIYHGRRGLGVHALSAVDIALYDLVGKQLERPAYQLLGGARRDAITPYATIWPGGVKDRTLDEMMEAIGAQMRIARELGYRAVKMEVIFGDLASDRELVECIREGRRLLGDDVTLALDFGYRWNDWRTALWVLDRVEDCDIYFAEATLQDADLAGHAKLAARVQTRVAGAEFAATLPECREWLERGRVDVLQPDVNRCGGLTELKRIADLASLHGALVVPHGWKSGITTAAERHFQAASHNVPFIETLVPELYDSPLRAELVRPEPPLCDGLIPLPSEPGLGVDLVPEAVDKYRVH
jgi:L-alanine-DL-glutamate epimerase-like enolase superfamily enzyme